MSRYITEDDVAIGYSSDQDEYESELVQDIILSTEPCEIYIGNTGKINPGHFYQLFKQYGDIADMSIWRTYNHLYHARIVYKTQTAVQNAIDQHNNQLYNGKRLRVSLASDKMKLNHTAAIRIDDICADCSEEDIYDHFSSCGVVCVVIKTGFAAYVQFEKASDVNSALGLEMILNGDPYTLARISADDRVDHVQVIENTKDIKYRKPFVMVENYPLLPNETPLNRYKASFESVGPVRHFKIAPTEGETVTLALCMEKVDDCEQVIKKFHDTMMDEKRLKLYMAPGTARMTIHHAATFALCTTSVVVTGIPPYYKDYDVSLMFRRCGEINFLERYEGKWLICFESYTAVSLTHYFEFMINRQRLKIENLSSETIPEPTHVPLRDVLVEAPEVKKTGVQPRNRRNVHEFMLKTLKAMDEEIKKKPLLNPFNKAAMSQRKKPEGLPNTQNTSGEQVITQQMKSNRETLASQAKPTGPSDKPEDVTPVQAVSERPNSKDNETQQENTDNEGMLGGLSRKRARVYIGNLPKGIEENDVRQMFQGKEFRSVAVYFSKDSYHPTSIAMVEFNNKEDATAVISKNHNCYRGKRLMIHTCAKPYFFLAERSLMVKNLNMNIHEEGLLDEIEKVLGPGSVNDIIKPAHHYAYVDFNVDMKKHNVLVRLREAFTRYKIDVFPLLRKISKRRMEPFLPLPAEEIHKKNELRMPTESDPVDNNFGVHNAHKLFVGNISRDSLAEDVIDYFNNFGQVVDYQPIEKKSCYLRKSAILSFVNPKHAANAYLYHGYLYFEGCALEVHLMDIPPLVFRPDALTLTVKFHSPFLTDDEICHALNHLQIKHYLRFDAFDDRANFMIGYCKGSYFDMISKLEYIKDEAVVFVDGIDWTPPKDDEAQESRHVFQSEHRIQKEQFLSYVVYQENLKEALEMRSKPNSEQDVPLRIFYNDNSVQINNVSLETTLEDIRDLFCKCGNVTEYQALVLEEDRSKICYVQFDVDLAADLACTYNQRMVNGKRILVHLAKETLHVERDRSIVVERLNPHTTTENIYDAFSSIGMIKYVQKQSPFTAIVCFKDKDCMTEAVNVTHIQNSGNFVINPCYEEYDPCFLRNFSVQEEFISIEKLRATLKPRIRPEYHQSYREREVFETLPKDVKTHLLNEVCLARRNIPGFNNLSCPEQIIALKTKHPRFTQKEHFVRLTALEQKKLLEMTENLQVSEEIKNTEIVPPPVKQPRNENLVNTRPVGRPNPGMYSSRGVPPSNSGMMYGGNMPSEAIGPPRSMGSRGGPGEPMGPLGPMGSRSSGQMRSMGPMGSMGSMGSNGSRRMTQPREGHREQQMGSMAYNNGPSPGQMVRYPPQYFR